MSKRRPKPNKTEHRMALALDQLAAYEEFCEDVLPSLRKALKDGKTAEDIYKMATAAAAARAVTIAVKEQDSSKALAAIKEIMDRSGGKPTERKEIVRKYEDLREEELNSLIISQLQEDTEDTAH